MVARSRRSSSSPRSIPVRLQAAEPAPQIDPSMERELVAPGVALEERDARLRDSHRHRAGQGRRAPGQRCEAAEHVDDVECDGARGLRNGRERQSRLRGGQE